MSKTLNFIPEKSGEMALGFGVTMDRAREIGNKLIKIAETIKPDKNNIVDTGALMEFLNVEATTNEEYAIGLIYCGQLMCQINKQEEEVNDPVSKLLNMIKKDR